MSRVPFRPSLALALLSAAALSAAAVAPTDAEPAFAPPIVVLANYDSHHLPRLIQAVRRSGLPPGTPIYFGNYYGSGFAGRKVRVPEPVRSRSEEHTSELRHVEISYAVFCLKKKKK